MAGLRATFSWMLRGRDHTVPVLEALTHDLQDLQAKVAGLEMSLTELRKDQKHMGERQLDEFDRVRSAVGRATDDLTARVNAVLERENSAR